ncbi:hypothetical protein HELRODRAFT_128228, partial [Helobdella robusta]|uniref:Disintegrin domain-containing protein n=1 Tax=Helobdella robusta TaxID=6412 RepID=T1EHM0_HELRO
PASCGNGLIDDGEDCDCGSFKEEICSRQCCNTTTCMFTPGSECATGLCCDFNTCKLKLAGEICREVKDECDIEDKCSGTSNLC